MLAQYGSHRFPWESLALLALKLLKSEEMSLVQGKQKDL